MAEYQNALSQTQPDSIDKVNEISQSALTLADEIKKQIVKLLKF